MSPFALRSTARLLRRGGVVAYATEGVFGIGCNPRDEAALRRIIGLKGRAERKGLILIAADEDQAMSYARVLPAKVLERIRATWPGPVTWILPARAGVSTLITGGRDTVALRVTAHPGVAALCRAFGGALVSTSANRTGRPPARTAILARRALGNSVDRVLPGATGGARGPSTIRDGRDGRVLRGEA